MDNDRLSRIGGDPRYRTLVRDRTLLSWWLTAFIVLAFIGFILLVAFDKSFLAQPISAGVTSLGIPVGLGVIALSILLTGAYVLYANGAYDRRLAEILEDHRA